MSKDKYDELFALYRATDKKNPAQKDIDALRQFLYAHPEQAKNIGDLAIQAEIGLLCQAFSDNRGGEVAADEVLYQMRRSLGYDKAPAIEKPLIYHISLCWLRLQLCEIRHTQATGSGCTIAQGAFWEKKLSAHQKRYLRAVETLARIRRLNISIQVNVADKMVVTG